jgi:2-methylcitrate dehydratase PrpD
MALDSRQTAFAFGIAGTQAAGLKSMFGTMCKPLHAGRAAYNGLFAARLASRGFESCSDVLETAQGFAATQSDGIQEIDISHPEGGFYLRSNLFKYHASCYLTHAAIECGRHLMAEHGLNPADVEKVVVTVNAGCDEVCNIADPKTGLEAKFSLRQTTAFALAGVDTARLDTFTELQIASPVVRALHKKTTVELVFDRPRTLAEMLITTTDGRRFSTSYDTGVPTLSIDEQSRKLNAKFLALVTPILGQDLANRILSTVWRLDQLSSVTELTHLFVQPQE